MEPVLIIKGNNKQRHAIVVTNWQTDANPYTNICIYACTHAHIYTHARARVHTVVRTLYVCTSVQILIHTHAYTTRYNTYIYKYKDIKRNPHTQTNTEYASCTHSRTWPNKYLILVPTCACTYTRIYKISIITHNLHTHTHTHTHV